MGNTLRQQQQRQQHRRPAEQGDHVPQERGGFMQLLQLLPIIVLFLMSFGGSGSSSQPTYSLYAAPPYVLPKITPAPLSIPFYVADGFDRHYQKGTEAHRRLMKDVETEYRNRLAHQCNTEQASRSRKIQQARSVEARTSAKSLSLPACDEFQAKFGSSARQSFSSSSSY